MNQPIAFFDSGIGGLSVLHKARKLLPNESFVYFADTQNVPYGTKSREQVLEYVDMAVKKLLQYRIKALVIACNTATSIAVNDLRQQYSFPIIGMEPAVKPALEKHVEAGKKVLVLATPLTLQQHKFNELVNRLDKADLIDALPLPELVQLCEALEFREEVILSFFNEKFAHIKPSQYSVVVLGCTHYPFYKRIFQQFFGNEVAIIDGNEGTVQHLKNTLQSFSLLANPHDTQTILLSSSTSPHETKRLEEALQFLSNT